MVVPTRPKGSSGLSVAKTLGGGASHVLGRAASDKLTALAWNRDLRETKTHRRAHSAGAQSALGKKPADARVFRPVLRHLADRDRIVLCYDPQELQLARSEGGPLHRRGPFHGRHAYLTV